MRGSFKDLVGKIFGRLLVLKRAESLESNRRARFWCQCSCWDLKNDLPVFRVVGSDALLNGQTKSCGCLQKAAVSLASKTHGQTVGGFTLEYISWGAMMSRCYNKNQDCYKNYGGRGIKVCEEWKNFENFFRDMGTRTKKLSLDRKDNDGNYELSNCRWATRLEQTHNRRIMVKKNAIGSEIKVL